MNTTTEKFWRKPSFWKKVETFKPHITIGASAANVGSILFKDPFTPPSTITQELSKILSPSDASDTVLLNFVSDMAIIRIGEGTPEIDMQIAVELFLDAIQTGCKTQQGGMLCDGIMIPDDLYQTPGFDRRKFISEEHIKYAELDKLFQNSDMFEEALRYLRSTPTAEQDFREMQQLVEDIKQEGHIQLVNGSSCSK